jgi:hypothetical protein
MKSISVIGATLVAAVLCAAPISLQQQDKGLSLSVDKAQARIHGYYGHGGYVPPGTRCKTAAKLVATDRKARHAFRHECKQAWKAAHKKAA